MLEPPQPEASLEAECLGGTCPSLTNHRKVASFWQPLPTGGHHWSQTLGR